MLSFLLPATAHRTVFVGYTIGLDIGAPGRCRQEAVESLSVSPESVRACS